MKYAIIAVLLLIVVLAVARSFNLKYTTGIETYKYKVIKTYNHFEIRTYESSLFTYVNLNGTSYKETSARGFRTLAGYIFGYNDKKRKIAMTSPVAMQIDDSITMMFLVPKKYKMEDLPKPINANIKFKQEPEKTVAAIRFSGWANDKKINTYKQLLQKYLDAENIKYRNTFIYLGYNPPYEILNRRNEIIVEINAH